MGYAMPPSDRHALVMKSTVPVGTGASIKRELTGRGKTGVRYVWQPGGSTRMDEVLAAADEHGMVMTFSGLRLFHH